MYKKKNIKNGKISSMYKKPTLIIGVAMPKMKKVQKKKAR